MPRFPFPILSTAAFNMRVLDEISPLPPHPCGAEYARLERIQAAAKIFAAVPRGERPRRLVRVELSGESWQIAEFWALGPDDQSVFLAGLAVLGSRLRPDDGRCAGVLPPEDERRRPLECEQEAARLNTVASLTTFREIARLAGWPWSGRREQLLRNSLERLAHTHLTITRGDVRASFSCLLAYILRNDRLLLEVNPYLARVFLSPQSSSWVRISLAERRQLSSDVAKLLHAWLSSWLRPGETQRATLDTLGTHVWPDDDPPAGTRRWRKHELRRALAEVGRLPGWTISNPDTEEHVTITRAAGTG